MHDASLRQALEGSGEAEVQAMNAPPPEISDADGPAAPSKKVYSGSSKDWGAIESDLKKAEEEEKPEGEEVHEPSIPSLQPHRTSRPSLSL